MMPYLTTWFASLFERTEAKHKLKPVVVVRESFVMDMSKTIAQLERSGYVVVVCPPNADPSRVVAVRGRDEPGYRDSMAPDPEIPLPHAAELGRFAERIERAAARLENLPAHLFEVERSSLIPTVQPAELMRLRRSEEKLQELLRQKRPKRRKGRRR